MIAGEQEAIFIGAIIKFWAEELSRGDEDACLSLIAAKRVGFGPGHILNAALQTLGMQPETLIAALETKALNIQRGTIRRKKNTLEGKKVV